MKRITAVFTAILLLIAALLPVGAAAPAFTREETEALYQKFCAHYGYTPHEINPDFPEFGERDIFQIQGVSNGFALCHAEHDYFMVSPAIYQARLNSYAVYAPNWYRPDKAAISVVSIDEDAVYTLEEAAAVNAVDMKDVAEAFPRRVRKLGDLNGDGELSLKDVLFLQKYLAQIVDIQWGVDRLAADFNGDGEPNLGDVVQMQKIIVKAI